MYEYRVISKMTELPPGSYFYAVPEVQIDTGTLTLFGVGESPYDCEHIIGRWFPDVAGSNWILQPERWIHIAKDVVFWIIGRVIPLDTVCFSWTVRSGLLVASAAIVEISGLVAPLLV